MFKGLNHSPPTSAGINPILPTWRIWWAPSNARGGRWDL